METHLSNTYARSRLLVTLAIMAAAFGCVQQANVPGYAKLPPDPYTTKRWSSPTFTTAHATFGDAAKEFLNIRPKA